MKSPLQIAQEIAEEIAEKGCPAFMDNEPYTPNQFREAIAVEAIIRWVRQEGSLS